MKKSLVGLTPGAPKLFYRRPLQLLLKIWQPQQHLATHFDAKYHLKWLYLVTYDEKNQKGCDP
jgi:hypothetical protein